MRQRRKRACHGGARGKPFGTRGRRCLGALFRRNGKGLEVPSLAPVERSSPTPRLRQAGAPQARVTSSRRERSRKRTAREPEDRQVTEGHQQAVGHRPLASTLGVQLADAFEAAARFKAARRELTNIGQGTASPRGASAAATGCEAPPLCARQMACEAPRLCARTDCEASAGCALCASKSLHASANQSEANRVRTLPRPSRQAHR